LILLDNHADKKQSSIPPIPPQQMDRQTQSFRYYNKLRAFLQFRPHFTPPTAQAITAIMNVNFETLTDQQRDIILGHFLSIERMILSDHTRARYFTNLEHLTVWSHKLSLETVLYMIKYKTELMQCQNFYCVYAIQYFDIAEAKLVNMINVDIAK
jgi:hypothetical protein